jgi:hypothetical protein
VKAIERRSPRALIGASAKFASALERLAPISYWRILQWR